LSNVYIGAPTPMVTDSSSLLFEKKTLPPVPKPAARSADALRRVAGTYKFGPDFYQPNSVVHIEPRDGYLLLRYPSLDVPLTPIANGEYFDRFYWSFVRFENGKLIYRNGSDEFTAEAQSTQR
jgi:hypothetical protein